MTGLLVVSNFLVSILFSLLLFLLWTRLALRYFRVSTLHPISQSINQFINPLVQPIEMLLPFTKKRLSRFDAATFGLIIGVEIIKYSIKGLLVLGSMMPMSYLTIYVVADLLIEPCNLLFYAVLIRSIMSWVNPRQQYPLADILHLITEPLLKRARKILPTPTRIDFSPFLVLLVLEVVTIYLSASLPVGLG